MNARIALLLAWAFCAPSLQAFAQTQEQLLERALAAYGAGLDATGHERRGELFRSAARGFSALIESGLENADLYSNLGNAALLGERPGDATLAYRRALLLDPDHAQASANLEYARGLLPAWVPRAKPVGVLDGFLWQLALSRSERGALAAFAFAAAVTLLAAALFWRSAWLRRLALLPALVWLAALATLGMEHAASAGSEAVIIGSDVIARAADSINAPASLTRPLPSGAEVRILEQREGWARVALADGRDGWVAASSVTAVGRR